jgi:nitroreductase
VKIVGQGQWIIGTDPQRRLPAVDPENRETLLSIGAFTENLSIAAAAMGYDAQTEIMAKGPFENDVVKVSLRNAKAVHYPLRRLKMRMTAKDGFLSKELKSDDIRALSEPLKDRLFYFPRGSEHGQCIQEGAVEYFRVQSDRDDAQRELAEWIRFRNKDAREHRDGLTTESMGITGFAGWYVRHFMNREDVMKERFRKQGVEKVAKQSAEGGGWVIITSAGKGVRHLIDTGRRFERMALMTRERNIAIHPMTQWLEEKDGQEKIGENHPPGFVPQFVLRVGYLDGYPEPVSLRRPVSWFVRT